MSYDDFCKMRNEGLKKLSKSMDEEPCMNERKYGSWEKIYKNIADKHERVSEFREILEKSIRRFSVGEDYKKYILENFEPIHPLAIVELFNYVATMGHSHESLDYSLTARGTVYCIMQLDIIGKKPFFLKIQEGERSYYFSDINIWKGHNPVLLQYEDETKISDIEITFYGGKKKHLWGKHIDRASSLVINFKHEK